MQHSAIWNYHTYYIDVEMTVCLFILDLTVVPWVNKCTCTCMGLVGYTSVYKYAKDVHSAVQFSGPCFLSGDAGWHVSVTVFLGVADVGHPPFSSALSTSTRTLNYTTIDSAAGLHAFITVPFYSHKNWHFVCTPSFPFNVNKRFSRFVCCCDYNGRL